MARLCHRGGTGGTWVNKEKEYMMYTNDNRIVMTLDAGGTNFVFSAIQGGKEIADPVVQIGRSTRLNSSHRLESRMPSSA